MGRPKDTRWKSAKTFLEILPFLTPKQKLFVEHYLDNGAQAAADAGYKGSRSYLSLVGHRMLNNAKMIRALELKNANNRQHSKIMDRQELQLTWSEIARDKDGAALNDRLKAMDSLAKSQGLFIDRVEVRGAIANLSMKELVDHIEHKARLLGVTVQLPALPDLDSHSDTNDTIQ